MYLVVVVKHRNHVPAEPGEIAVVVQFRISKEGEVLVGFQKAFDHRLQPARDIFDSERGIQPGRVHHRPCVAAAASHLPGKKETLLPKTLCELVNCGAENPCGLLAHVLNCVDAKTVYVGVCDPVRVTVDEVLKGR